MRIAMIAPDPALQQSSGGGARSRGVTALAEVLAELGHDVTVYARKDSGGRAARATLGRGVSLVSLPAGGRDGRPAPDLGSGIRAFSEQLAQRWRDDPPDVAHAHSWPAGLAALAGARDLDVPVVQTFCSAGSGTAGSPSGDGAAGGAARASREQAARVRLKVSLARHVNGVLATSSQEMRELTGLGVPRNSIRVVPWGVDTSRFAPEGPVAKRNGRPRLLAVAPISPRQGLDVVIRALTEVPEAELVVAPPGGAESGAEAVSRLCEGLGVAGRVRWLPGVAARDMPALLRSADLLVSAGWDEPLGGVVLQAMACGTPVVAPAVGTCQDAIIDGTTGLLVPPGQPGALARRIRSLLSSPLRLEAFGIAAADRARARYSWDRIGQETVQAYEGCLPGEAAARHPAHPVHPVQAA